VVELRRSAARRRRPSPQDENGPAPNLLTRCSTVASRSSTR
jgi:hypothetical protein